MKSIRFTLVALVAMAALVAGGSTLFADDGIEVLAQDGIEVLGIEVLGIEVLQNNGIEVLGIEVLAADGIEVLGIEVLGIEVLDSGAIQFTLRTPNAPAGSYVEADVNPNGEAPIPVDIAPVDPGTREARVTLPAGIPGTQISINTPNGTVVLSIGYAAGVEFD